MPRVAQPAGRTPVGFGISGAIHAAALTWLMTGSLVPHAQPALSVYDQEIRPNEHRLVWYHVRGRLPDVSPARSVVDRRPSRALRKFDQTLVAGRKDNPASPPQLVWNPAPEPASARLEPLPNALAVPAPSRPVREFRRPETAMPRLTAPALPEDGGLRQAPVPAPLALAAVTSAPTRAFTAPQTERRSATVPRLPEAPGVASPALDGALGLGLAGLAAPVRGFSAPKAEDRRLSSAPQLPEAPAAAAPQLAGLLSLPSAGPARPVRTFAAPAAPAPLESAVQAVSEIPDAVAPAVAIAGLKPANGVEIPALPAPRTAEFSAGPQPRPEGGSGDTEPGSVVVPGLLARGGGKEEGPTLVARIAPFTREGLIAAARPSPAGAAPPTDGTGAARLAAAPDPLLQGRVVYMMAIQMPNVTSYIGSWLVWFAERQAGGARAPAIRAPFPLRKVDPKYVASAVYDRVEGVVRLSAVIRKDGAVEAVKVIKQLDDRLDQSAQEALGKWQFEPALRDGVPVEVDAIFEVPFRLAPRPAK